MKKLLFVLLAVITVYSCQKKDGPATPQEVDVEFVIQQTDFGGLKSTNDDVPQCSTDSWDYVEFVLNGTTYYSPIIPVSGGLYTMAFKLPSGAAGLNYSLTKFLVMHDAGVAGIKTDDVIVMAAPEPLALYHSLMENPLNINIFIEGFIKKEIVIDVLCFEDLYYEAFGFTWFKINDVKIERQCFFGDICTGKMSMFNSSLYATQSQGVQLDMPAITMIEVRKKVGGVYPTAADNIFRNDIYDPVSGLWQFPGEGACLEVFWANDLDVVETFKFDLFVWLPQGGVFQWVYVRSWVFDDAACPDPGTDGVVDFVLGACQQPDADFNFGPWMDLPTSIQATISHSGSTQPYWDITVTSVNPGGTYEFGLGYWPGWCFDQGTTIGSGSQTFYPVSSLWPTTWPVNRPAYLNGVSGATKLKIINWIFNHLDDLNVLNRSGATLVNLTGSEGDLLQQAVWTILHATGTSTMAAHATTVGFNYIPPPGGWAGVMLFRNTGTGPYDAQLLMVQVDP